MLNILAKALDILIQSFGFIYFYISLAMTINNRVYNKKTLTISFFCILCIVIFGKFLLFPFNTIFCIIGSLLFVYFVLHTSLIKSLFLSVLLPIILAILELIALYLSMFIFDKDANQLLSSDLSAHFLVLLHSLLTIIVVKMINITIEKKNNIKILLSDLKPKQIKTFLITSVICIFPQMLLFVFNKYNYSLIFLIINSIQMIIFSIFILLFLKRSIEYEKTQNELRLSELHNKTMVGMVDGIRILKHDYNNIIQALSGYVSTKQYDKLEEHILNVMKECNAINTISIITPELFDEPAIYGIVGAKYFIAVEKDVTFELDVCINTSEINFSMPELSRILGILLDNALESTSQIDNKYVKVEMKFDFKKCADVIRIINTYDTSQELHLEKMYEKGFSTKKVKSGLGLWEVAKIISKSKNAQIYPSIEKDKFVQNIIIER